MKQINLIALCRFMAKVKLRNSSQFSSGCWHWIGARNADGYGILHVKGKTQLAHRFLFALLSNKKLSVEELICHRCDTPSCVNPAHLFLGTASDNMRDMIAKGRDRKSTVRYGENVSTSRFKEVDVLEMRRLYKAGASSYAEIGNIYGARASVIHSIVSGKTWKHLPK